MTKITRAERLTPLRTMFALSSGTALPLTAKLARLYGSFRLPKPSSHVHVFSNFVSSVDGIVSLQEKGHSGGGDISGFSIQDRMVMGLLRAAADVVVVGSGTLDADAHHVWTPAGICPELADEYRRLEISLGKAAPSVNVVVSARGLVNLRLPVFASGKVSAMILTTEAGAKRLSRQKVPDSVRICAVGRRAGEIPARVILAALKRVTPGRRILVEGGPRLLAAFYKERLIDEQFLSLAPQISGRVMGDARMGLVMGETFAPKDPLWGRLVDVRRGSRLLFLRYAFPTDHARNGLMRDFQAPS
jgi:riboflavin biosynthesis pyrimidine reductase